MILFCVFAISAKGQSSAGVKADMNLSGLLTNQSTHLKIRMKAGGSAGFFYKNKWSENRAVQADLMFRYHASELKTLSTSETADYRYFGVELPVYFLMQADFDDRKLYLGMGPFASFGLFSQYKSGTRTINPYKKDPTGDRARINRWDFGVGFIIGYELKCNLQFNFNYQLGLRNLLDTGLEKVEMFTQLVSLGVGYRF